MKYYRIIVNVLCISFLLVGCYQEQDNNTAEIVYNCPADAYQIKKIKEEAIEFEKEHNVKIKIIPFSGEEKLLAMMAADQEPDVFYTNNILRDKLAAENRIIDVRKYAKKDAFIANIRPETIEQGKSIDGGWYHLCNWTFTYAVYFNKSIFKSANLPYPKNDWTWEEMVNIAKKLTIDFDGDGKIDQYGIYIAPHFISAFEKMNHAEYKPNSLLFEIRNESIEVYNLYIDLFKKHKVMPQIEKIESMGMQYSQLLENGKIAMIIEALPNLDLLQQLKIDWDMVALPSINNKSPEYFRAYGGGLSISARCKHPQKAWEFIKWLVFKSSIFTPNPMLIDSNFTNSYIAKYPILANTNFKNIWDLSEKYNGGDSRDFVRYSSWTAATILERTAPLLENVLRGKESIDNYIKIKDDVNNLVRKNIKDYLTNPSVKIEFKNKIENELLSNDFNSVAK